MVAVDKLVFQSGNDVRIAHKHPTKFVPDSGDTEKAV